MLLPLLSTALVHALQILLTDPGTLLLLPSRYRKELPLLWVLLQIVLTGTHPRPNPEWTDFFTVALENMCPFPSWNGSSIVSVLAFYSER